MKKDVEIVLSESEKEFDLIDTLMLNFLTTNDITSYTKYIRKTTNGFKNCDPEIVREFLRNYKELFDDLCDEVGIQVFCCGKDSSGAGGVGSYGSFACGTFITSNGAGRRNRGQPDGVALAAPDRPFFLFKKLSKHNFFLY